MTPTARTLQYLRSKGYVADVAERWNSYSRTRKDLLGIADVVAAGPGGILAVQATTSGNLAARCTKIAPLVEAKAWLQAGGRLIVMGWAKQGPRGKRKTWQQRQVHAVLDPTGERAVVWMEGVEEE